MLNKNSSSVGSPRSYGTALSSFGSYKTASGGYRHPYDGSIASNVEWAIEELAKDQARAQASETLHPVHATQFLDESQLIEQIVDEFILHSSGDAFAETSVAAVKAELGALVATKTTNLIKFGPSGAWTVGPWTRDLIAYIGLHSSFGCQLHDDVSAHDKANAGFDDAKTRKSLQHRLEEKVELFVSSGSRPSVPNAAFSTQWLSYLHDRGILLDPWDELDWSGRGQHVEYGRDEGEQIPLIFEKTLGHSASAVIDSVRCRRIRLARKLITCNRRLKKEDAVIEVEHLFRLPHSHIIRVVGTYTHNKDLAILLYPATEWDLDSFMEYLLDEEDPRNMLDSATVPFKDRPDVSALPGFIGCLSSAIAFIHESNIKHMDIKPKNLLVRKIGAEDFKIYIADFGIARAYKTAAEANTESPTAFTRAYAAPEVVIQDTRGFAADIFSLGCVFIEICATWRSYPSQHIDERHALQELLRAKTGSGYFHTCIPEVLEWFSNLRAKTTNNLKQLPKSTLDAIPNMIAQTPESRLTAYWLRIMTEELRCPRCHDGPEPFEAADGLRETEGK